AFTNYGTGHAGSQEQSVEAALIQGERRVEGSPSYPLAVVRDGETLGFAINDEGVVEVGTAEDALAPVDDAAVNDAGVPTSVPGWDVVPRGEFFTDQDLQQQVVNLRVPVSDDANDGSIRTREGSTGTIYKSQLVWDADAQTITDVDTGTVYRAT